QRSTFANGFSNSKWARGELCSLCLSDSFGSGSSTNMAMLLVPANGSRKSWFDRSGLVAQFPFGLIARNEHPMSRHLYAFDGNLRLAAAQAREEFIGIARSECYGMRQAHTRRGTPYDDAERAQDLSQGHIPSPQDVALANSAALRRK